MFLFRGIDPEQAIAEANVRTSLANVLASFNDAREPALDDLRRVAPLVAKMEYPYLYLNAEYARELSQHVAEFLVWIPSARLSVRNLKAVIKRLDARIRDWVTYEFDPLDTEPKNDPGDPVVTRLEALAARSETSAALKQDLDDAIAQLRARVQERHRSRDWIWAQLHHLALEVFDA